MTNLKTMLMTSVAAITLAAAPTLAQEATSTEGQAPEAQQQMTEAAPAERSFDENYGESFSGLGDRNVEELVGTRVVNDAGETIGEVDNFGLSSDEQIVAIVGIGGFLGMGEHSVALPLDQLTFDGEQLLLSGVTREELEAMPEYDEGAAQTFAADQTLRGGYEGTGMPGMTTGSAPTDTAAVQPSEDPAADQPMEETEAEVADAAETGADNETTVEEQVSEAGEGAEGAMEEAGQEVAQASEQAGDAAEQAGEQVAQTAENAGEAAQEAGSEATQEVAQATDEATDEAGQTTETAETEMQDSTEAAQTETAASDQAEPTGGGTETATMAEGAEPAGDEPAVASTDETAQGMADETETAAGESGWTEEMDTIFADIADQQITELIGMDVASAEGEVVGQVDNFALSGEDVVAIVGIGGFLGIGEHQVALSLGDMTYDGEKLVLSSMTEDQLREMPEYDEAEANYLPEDGTLRSTYDQ